MKRFAPIVLVLALLLVLGIWFWRSSAGKTTHEPEYDSPTRPTTPTSPSPQPPLLGEVILRDYANASQPPEHDLTLLSRLMENSLLLLKSAGQRPLSANEDWADLLRGRKSARERFLPDDSVALDAQGRLIDRWGKPLFFHALGGGRYEIRSAGPDQTLWTADDIHRNADGSFRRGADLNSASLLETATRGRSPSTGP